MTLDIELQACPFCHCKPYLFCDRGEDDFTAMLKICCDGCNTEMVVGVEGIDLMKKLSELIGNWQR